jgi:hypothetical protein
LLLGGFSFFPPRTVSLAGAVFRVVRRGRSARRYIHIHGNETTAREVLEGHIRRHEGIAYLIRGNERNVPIGRGAIDPNRMFSAEGARANLARLNPSWAEPEIAKALQLLDRGREKLLHSLAPPPGGVLIALHNNQDYSVRDELEASQRSSLKQPDRPRYFFLCTDPADYETLAASPYNVVLQNAPPPPDDGSLSRAMARRGVRYVNLECALGDRASQTEMIGWADGRLR